METVALQASVRDGQGKGPSRRLRNTGRIPVVAYGREQATLNLSVSTEQLRDILLSDRGRNSLIDLQVDGDGNHAVMIKEFTLHPISRKLVHADFIRIDATATIEVRVPFRTTGKSKGEVAGGTILVNVREVKVLCAANAIPVVIEADVTHLQIDDELKIKDLELPAGTELNESPERKLLIVAPPRVAEAEEEVEDENADGDAAAGGADAAAKGDARSTDGTS